MTQEENLFFIDISYQFSGYVLYKSIMLSNNDKTKHVIRNAMMKLGIQGNPEDYTLSQVSAHRG